MSTSAQKKNMKKGKNVFIAENVVLGNNITLGDNVYIDNYAIIRDNTIIENDTYIGAYCIIGEYLNDFCTNRENEYFHQVHIGAHSIIRSNTIIYGDNEIGEYFQTGHRATIREHSQIGKHVSVGTLCDVQGFCKIGNYVRMHSNVHVGQESVIESFVWIFPYVVLTNDPTPPSNNLSGVTIKSYAVISTGSVLLPGVTIEGNTLVAAGAIVTKDVKENSVVGGNPAKVISQISSIKNHVTGEEAYPWQYHFKRGMPWEDSDYEDWMKNNYEK